MDFGHGNTRIAAVCALGGGGVKWLILNAGASGRIGEAVFTAGLCALVGLLVKDVYGRAKKAMAKHRIRYPYNRNKRP